MNPVTAEAGSEPMPCPAGDREGNEVPVELLVDTEGELTETVSRKDKAPGPSIHRAGGSDKEAGQRRRVTFAQPVPREARENYGRIAQADVTHEAGGGERDDRRRRREGATCELVDDGMQGTKLKIDKVEQLQAVVLPVMITPEGEAVAVPEDPEMVLGLDLDNAKMGPAAIEEDVKRALRLEGVVHAYRAGLTATNQRVMVAVVRHDESQRLTHPRGPRGTGLRILLWCMLGALLPAAPQTRWAQLAVCAVRQFRTHDGATTHFAKWEHSLRGELGANPGRTSLMSPARTLAGANGGAITARGLLDLANQGLTNLREAMEKDTSPLAEYYRGWADKVQPLQLQEVPRELLDKPLHIESPRLAAHLFAPRIDAHRLPWLNRMPKQREDTRSECQDFRPSSAQDLFTEGAQKAVQEWLQKAEKDLRCLEEQGPECPREDKPPVVALGQLDLKHCARGVVWDCREPGRCRYLDYTAPLETDLDLGALRRRFEGYPDQRLASYILEGVRLEADVEWQVVLHPNLVTVGEGYASVQETARQLAQKGFYDLHKGMPFVPMYVIGQGSRIKKLGVKKYRRTSNFSAPHKEVRDREGVRVIPVNEASKCYYRPRWLLEAKDIKLEEWDKERYRHVKWTNEEQREASVRFKYPKEEKPMLVHVLTDLAILMAASIVLDEPVFAWVEDAAFYFNQFAYAPEELWKSTFVVGAREGDAETKTKVQFTKYTPVFISEKRLGFGSFASSNIAQRFSNAVVQWTLERFDELEREAEAMAPKAEAMRWKAQRKRLEQRCLAERPQKRGKAPPDCNQTRLGTLHMYTDDPIAVVVGVERTMRMIRAWKEVTEEIGLVMAGEEKRQLGGQLEWVGVMIFSILGLVVIPRNKLLRAKDALLRARASSITFGEYRALMGLLEHLRFVARLEADTTNALYRPHGARGESKDGPSAVVRPDDDMRRRLDKWLEVILQCAGAVCTMAIVEEATDALRAAHDVFMVSSDAAGDGRGTPGMGGYVHGVHWRVPLSTPVLRLLHITGWEALASVIATMIASRMSGEDTLLAIRSDALMVPHAIAKRTSSSETVQDILTELQELPQYENLMRKIVIEHLSGEGNIMSDLVSRGLWEEYGLVCQAIRVRPTEAELTEGERAFIMRVLSRAAARKGIAPPTPQEVFGTTGLTPPPRTERWEKRGRDHIDRKRTLHSTEQARGKRFSHSEEGDGPFVPPWRLQPKPTAETPTSTSPQKRFSPPWKRTTHTSPPPAISRPEHPQPGLKKALGHALRPLNDHDEAHAVSMAKRLASDRTPGRINADEASLLELTRAVVAARADGANPRTAKKHKLAWREFQEYAGHCGFDPNLRTEWTRRFPERENIKLAGFLLFTAGRMRPRARGSPSAKPMSVYQRYTSLRKVFQTRDQELPPTEAVREVLRGMVKRFIRAYGIEELRPRRVEPVDPTLVRKLVRMAKAGNQQIAGRPWQLQWWPCFITTAWMAINMSVGSRKAESVRLPGDVDHNDWFTRASVTYVISGRTCEDPTEEQLRSMRPGDMARMAPKGAKCDLDGTCHGTEPIILPFAEDDANAARWLRDIEVRKPCHGEDRRRTALFCRPDGQPYTDSSFASLIQGALSACLGPTRARLYSPHSWRVGLASALRMVGADDATIQALGRWLNPDSVKIYARMTVQEYAKWILKVMEVKHIDATRTTNLPILDEADAFAVMDNKLIEEVMREQGKHGPKKRVHQTLDDDEPMNKKRTNMKTPRPPAMETPAKATHTKKAGIYTAREKDKLKNVPTQRLTTTTTGVGSIHHKFPRTLTHYTTYKDRISKRRQPTKRHRAEPAHPP